MAAHNATYRPLIELARQMGDILSGIGFETGFYTTAADLKIDRFTEDVPGHPDVEHRVTVVHAPGGPLRAVVAVNRREPIPMPHEHFIKTPDDAENFLAIPYVPIHVDVAPFIQRDRQLGDRGLAMIGIGCDPIGDVHGLLGTETLAFWSVQHRDLVHRLLDEQLRRKLDVIQQFNASGIHAEMPVLFTHTGAEIVVPPLHSPSDFRDFCVRYDRPLHDAIHSGGGFVRCHCHGSLSKILEDFVEAGVDMLQPVEPPPEGDTSLEEAKRRIGDRLVIEGNIQFARLAHDEPTAFRDLVRQTVADGKPGGRFVLCPTASPYWTDLPDRALANYQTLIDVALTDGQYD